MYSLATYYLDECAKEKVEKYAERILESKLNGEEIEALDLDNDGIPDEFFMDLDSLIDSEIEFELVESMKARAPKLKGKAEKARKAKSNIMKSLMSNPEIQGLIARLKSVLKRTARKSAKTIGVSGRMINKALSGKVKI